jgi:hypothetical protein
MDQVSLVQQSQSMEQLLRKDAHQGGAETSELVLLDKFIKIDTKQFKHQAEMLTVNECVLESQDMVFIVLIKFLVQLCNIHQ